MIVFLIFFSYIIDILLHCGMSFWTKINIPQVQFMFVSNSCKVFNIQNHSHFFIMVIFLFQLYSELYEIWLNIRFTIKRLIYRFWYEECGGAEVCLIFDWFSSNCCSAHFRSWSEGQIRTSYQRINKLQLRSTRSKSEVRTEPDIWLLFSKPIRSCIFFKNRS